MLKKQIASVFMVAAIFLFSFSLMAQEKIDQSIIKDLNKTPKLAIGAKNERHIKGGIKIYEQLIENGAKIENFEIVIWGKVIKEILDNPELFQFIEEHGKQDKLKLSVCQVAMDKLEVSIDELPSSMRAVPNAWIRMFQLEAQGYSTIVP